MPEYLKPSEEINSLIRKTGDSNFNVAIAAQHELAQAIQEPLREGIQSGPTMDGIFTPDILEPGASPEYSLSFLAPGTEKDFVAYTMPNHGMIPRRQIEGDYVMVPTYRIANAIDWELRYARSVRWPILSKALEVLKGGFINKMSDDGAHVVLAAATDRNIVCFDSDAAVGQLTKRLITIGKIIMRRNGGGNSTSRNRAQLTDLYMSPENHGDIANWGVDILDEFTRREVFQNDGMLSRVFGVNLHVWDELGAGNSYQDYFTSTLGGSLASTDEELLVGLDLSKNDCFLMPVKEELSIFEDTTLHRQGLAGFYGWMELGFAVLDARRCILLSN